jgi:pectate lyase
LVSLSIAESAALAQSCPIECDGLADRERCALVRELLSEREGFGRDAEGGAGGPIVYVTTDADKGDGSLRAALAKPGPKWIRFCADLTIKLKRPLDVPSHTTIDGRGHSIHLLWRGLRLQHVENVIIESLTIARGRRGAEDAIEIRAGSRKIWIDHNRFERFPDELIGITRGATDVTVSWSEFTNNRKVLLCGCSPDVCVGVDDREVRLTLHHNFFHSVDYRLPWVKMGKAHLYNNLFRSWSSPDNDAVRVSWDGQAVIERNIFLGNNDSLAVLCSFNADKRRSKRVPLGRARLSENRFSGPVSQDPRCLAEGVFEPASFYAYNAAPADDALEQQIKLGVGPR